MLENFPILCRNRSLDPSAAVLWAMAVATVVGAALWAGSDFRQEVKSAGRGTEDEVTHCSFLLPCYIVCCAFFFL